MGAYLQFLALSVTSLFLIWLGYTLFFGTISPAYPAVAFWRKPKYSKGVAGDPETCPICSVRLRDSGNLIKSKAYPGSSDRMMYVRGCPACLQQHVPRSCPICGVHLRIKDYLISRVSQYSNNRSHVHVLGCNCCKRVGKPEQVGLLLPV